MTSEEQPVKLTYYQKNKEKCLAQAKAYQAAHKDHYKTYFREYYHKNKSKIVPRQEEYRRTHKEQINKTMREAYRRKHPESFRLQESRKEMIKKVRELIQQAEQETPLHPPLVEEVEVKEEEVTKPLIFRQEGNFTISWD